QYIGAKQSQQQLLLNIGGIYYCERQYPQAIGFLQSALLLAQELKNVAEEAKVLFALGATFHRLSSPLEAISYYRRAYSIYKRLGDEKLAQKMLRMVYQLGAEF
ncbi:tetratricopeptide repeat protein, partial [Aetokthonos hydrillicola]